MALLLHRKNGRRTLIVDGLMLSEGDVDGNYLETFDEIVALCAPACVLAGKDHAAKRLEAEKAGVSRAAIVAAEKPIEKAKR